MHSTVETADLIRAIKAASCAMSSDPTRTHLRGVMFEAEGDTLHVVGTNGHTLIDVRLPSRHDDPRGRAFLPAARIKATLAYLKTQLKFADVDPIPGITPIGPNDFPQWRQVIPSNERAPSCHVSLSPVVLDVAAKAGKALARHAAKNGEPSVEGWRFRVRDDLDPVVLEWAGAITRSMSATLLLMPMRL